MKKKLRIAEGVFIVTLLITLLLGQELFEAEETLPTPEEIIAKNIEAIGGVKALKIIKNKKIVTFHKIFHMNKEAKETIYQERSGNFYKLRVDLGEPDWRERWGYDGKNGWIVNPHSGAKLFEGVELSNFIYSITFDGVDGPDVRYKSMKTEGIELINGKECYKILKILEEPFKRAVYYDKKSFMIVKSVEYGLGNNKLEIYNEEYKKKNGILFPYKEVLFLNDRKWEEITFEKIELNIKMPEGIFDIPEEVKAIMNKPD
jgi:hypothetical protein